MPEITLNGCAPVPLAHYLKALGILRIIAEQADATAAARWSGDSFVLSSRLDEAGLQEFFLEEYQPTPVLAPWNGGSGFYPKDNRSALKSIAAGETPRLFSFREAISGARSAVETLGLKEKPNPEQKATLLLSCRNTLSEAALRWLDAALVLTTEGPKYPPLLGTGGNDGRLEFTNNFMQRLTEVMDADSGTPSKDSLRWLRAALQSEPAPRLATKAPIGQFFPGATGGANATAGFDGPGTANPWDFILMLEGALFFAAATAKRMESSGAGVLAYPFCVRQAGVGYPSATSADEADARCEMWMPLWSQPASCSELQSVFAEGRAQVRGRPSRHGVDFTQAIATLGVDRGIDSFQRFGFQVRNGLAYFATPLDRHEVRRNPAVDLLADIDSWYDRFRQKAGQQANPDPPSSVRRALNRLERSIVSLCREKRTARVRDVLRSLGMAERACAGSLKWTNDAFLRPLTGLRAQWLEEADDGSVEFRLAASVAGARLRTGKQTLHFRQHLEPVSVHGSDNGSWVKWLENDSNDVAWKAGDLTDSLNAVLSRRLMRIRQAGVSGWPEWSPRTASFDDVTAFIEGRTDDALLADLIWGLSLLDWKRVEIEKAEPGGMIPSAFFAMLRLCLRPPAIQGDPIPVVPAIFHRAMAGEAREASQLAARRLRGSGLNPLVDSLPLGRDIVRRTTAAMLFPLSPRAFEILEGSILNQQKGQ